MAKPKTLKNGRAGNTHGMNWIRPAKRLAIYMRDEFRCAYCQCNLHHAAPGQCSLDHLTPRSAGGSNEATNLITACLSCNVARGTKPWTQFADADSVQAIRRNRRRAVPLAAAKAILA